MKISFSSSVFGDIIKEELMLFQEATPDTVGYLIAGYVVIFGLIGLFLFSLVSRWRNLKKDLSLLNELENDNRSRNP